MKQTSVFVVLIAVAIVGTSQGAILFDFESLTPTSLPRNGAHTLLPMTQGGLTVTLSRTTGTAFDVVANTGSQAGKPAAWGSNSLDPFFALPGADAFLADFSMPLTSLSIEFGDYGPSDDDSPVTLTAYSGLGASGSVVGADSQIWGANAGFPSFGTASVSPRMPFRSVLFTSGGQFTNSLFWDNMVVTTGSIIPAPGAVMLGGIGMGLVGWLRRRRTL